MSLLTDGPPPGQNPFRGGDSDGIEHDPRLQSTGSPFSFQSLHKVLRLCKKDFSGGFSAALAPTLLLVEVTETDFLADANFYISSPETKHEPVPLKLKASKHSVIKETKPQKIEISAETSKTQTGNQQQK